MDHGDVQTKQLDLEDIVSARESVPLKGCDRLLNIHGQSLVVLASTSQVWRPVWVCMGSIRTLRY